MTQKLTILFDLDGTLADTAPDLMKAHNFVMDKFGYSSKSMDEIRNLVGRGAAVMIGRSIWGSARKELSKISDDKIKKDMTKEFIKFYEKNLVVETKLLNGVYDFLEWAKSNKISMGVCTNKQEHLAIELLKQIKIYDFFEYVAGGNTFEVCKPDPKHITNMVEIMGGEVNKTIMIGDSEVDEMSAHNAKLPFILVKDGYTEKSEKEIKHEALISDFVNFEKVIEKYL